MSSHSFLVFTEIEFFAKFGQSWVYSVLQAAVWAGWLSGMITWAPKLPQQNPQPANSKSTESGGPQRNYIDYLAANSRDCRVYRHSRDCLFIWYDHIRSTRCVLLVMIDGFWWMMYPDCPVHPIYLHKPSWQTEQDELTSKTLPLSCPTPTATVVLSSPRTVFQPEYGVYHFGWGGKKNTQFSVG